MRRLYSTFAGGWPGMGLLLMRLVVGSALIVGASSILWSGPPPHDSTLQGYSRLPKIFFAPTATSQAAGEAFIARIARRKDDLEPSSGPEVAAAQMAAFREWERFNGERFADLKGIGQPTLVVNGIHDEMIPVSNSYWLSENLPNAVLLTYPDSGHGSLFQFHESFTRQAMAFLDSDSRFAPY